MEADVTVRCFRCKEPSGLDDLGEYKRCRAMTCGILPCNGRCMCYELRLTAWPESKAYYDLLDRMNAQDYTSTREVEAIEAVLGKWEAEFQERGL